MLRRRKFSASKGSSAQWRNVLARRLWHMRVCAAAAAAGVLSGSTIRAEIWSR
jgi:hypothetical protein